MGKTASPYPSSPNDVYLVTAGSIDTTPARLIIILIKKARKNGPNILIIHVDCCYSYPPSLWSLV